MADQLNMNGLTLKDSQHAAPPNGQQNGFAERSAYIPPHLRQRGGGPPAAAAAGGPPPVAQNGNFPPPGAQKYALVPFTSASTC
jgi:ATP-dependent RNA helicase DDX3X